MKVFVDTNVLVYVRDGTEPEKQTRAAEWVGWLWETGLGTLSYQILQEYYVTLTRKLDPPRPLEDVRDDVAALLTWRPVEIEQSTLERAWSVQDRLGYSWWDSLIVAAALGAGARYLLSENLHPGQEVGGLTIINPFDHAPEEVLAEMV